MTPEELALFRSGDQALFRRLVERESPRLLGYAVRLTRDLDEARELAQRTWVRAFERRASFTASGSLQGWLLAICRSQFHDGLRVRSREVRVAGEAAEDGRSAEAAASEPADAVGPTAGTRLADALGALAPQQRDVVVLRVLEGWSTRETARRLGIAEGTVKATLHHSLEKLRFALRGVDDGD